MRPAAILGFLIFYDPKLPWYAEARGIWPFQKIFVGPSFNRLTEREKGAVLLHEAGHCKLHHAAKRLLFVLSHPRILLAMLLAAVCVSMQRERDLRLATLDYMRRVHEMAPQASKFMKQQEYEADKFAAGCGYGLDLAELYTKLRDPPVASFHPDNASRIARLTNMKGA